MQSGSEITFDDDQLIVSKTDTRGRITYVNRAFMRIVDDAEQGLLGKDISIIRHPDMPAGMVSYMSDLLDREEEFIGYTKHINAQRKYFWVLASITPDRDAAGRLVGYHTVGRKPRPEAVSVIETLYLEMLSLEQGGLGTERVADSMGLLSKKLATMKMSYDEYILSL